MPVRLPEAARVDTSWHPYRSEGPNRNARIEGGLTFAGIALVPDPYTPAAWSDAFVVGRFAGCSACSHARNVSYVDCGKCDVRWRTLPPGDYTLLFLTDGPATVTVEFRGLSGMATLRPRGVVDWETHEPAPTITSGVDGTWQAGTEYAAGTFGFSLSYVSFSSRRLEGTTAGICEYSGLALPIRDVAFGPHCSALTKAMGTTAVYQIPALHPRRGRFSLFALSTFSDKTFPPNLTGRNAIGAWIAGPQVKDPSHQALTVTLDKFARD